MGSGPHRPRRRVSTAVGLAGVALGVAISARWPAAVGLVLTGVGMSAWDVAMNVAGAEVERRLGRALMPRLHAAFSLGTVAGAGIGTATTVAGIPLPVQVLGAAVLAGHVGILRALLVVAGALTIALFVTGATRQPALPRKP